MLALKTEYLVRVAFAALLIEAATILFLPRSVAAGVMSEVVPAVLILLSILGFWRNALPSGGLLRSFWFLHAVGFCIMLFSQLYWALHFLIYNRNSESSENSVPGDALFLLSLVPVLAALALRPHAQAGSAGFRFRRIDFILLTAWWCCLYLYFAIPWVFVLRNVAKYDHVTYLLFLVEHAVVALICLLWARASLSAWRTYYLHSFIAFFLFAAGNFTIGLSAERNLYYPGSIYDLPWAASLVWMCVAIHMGRNLGSAPEAAEVDEGGHGLGITRLAMLALLSLPALSIWGYSYSYAPAAIGDFRLRLAFGAMLALGALVFFKIRLLDRELLRLVHLTASSVQNLKSVQAKLSQSQKMAALGRLAAGAGHEISNPLTAILGYSELLGDNPALSDEEREKVGRIQQQVHRAQAAVSGMRNVGRGSASVAQINKNPSP
jgi:signal transduction histidine kinase